jgi:hypothetical protein
MAAVRYFDIPLKPSGTGCGIGTPEPEASAGGEVTLALPDRAARDNGQLPDNSVWTRF